MYFERRLIAMLDILGFSEKLKDAKKLIETLDEYIEMISDIKDTILVYRSTDESRRDLDAHIFSHAEFAFDSLVLVSQPLTPANTGAFIGGTGRLMTYFAQNQMPLRGAIGIGDFAVRNHGPDTRVAVSTVAKALSNAEQHQQWSGCYILPEYESTILGCLNNGIDVNSVGQSECIYRYPIPLKDGKRVDAYCLNWIAGMTREDITALLHHMNPVPQKRSNTEEFINFVRQFPRTEYPLPDNFRPAVTATVVRCGVGIQIHLWDKDGHGATSMGCKHLVFDPKQPKENAFRGYNSNEEELALRTCW